MRSILILVAVTACSHHSSSGGTADAPPIDIDASTAECQVATDCLAVHGAPPCGAYQCVAGACELSCPGCNDADHDGYGVDAVPGSCAGADCDDTDPAVHDTAPATSCYSGGPGTAGVGACRAGTNSCTAGVWSPCAGEVVPSGEACNGQDDDCNGTSDDNLGAIACGVGACATTSASCVGGATGTCTPLAPLAANDTTCDGVDDDCDGVVDEDCAVCVKVAPTGNDALAIGNNNATPFLTVQAAVTYAAGATGRPHTVCVAAGATCGLSNTYNGAVTMADGISVNGGYESTTYTQCANSTTTLATGTATGVLFPSTVVNPTSLGDMQVDRATLATTSAITIDGAKQVTIAHVTVTNAPAVTKSYAVDIINGGDATITRSQLTAGSGSTESIAVRVVGSKLDAIANCQTIDPTSHRCTTPCGTSGFKSRTTVGTGDSYGVLLDNSPSSQIVQTGVCGGDADHAAGIRVKTAGAGIVIRQDAIVTFGGITDSHGLWLEDCGGDAPWVVDNERIFAGGIVTGTTPTPNVDGVHAVGACHPVIDSNVLISGGGEGNTVGANGVHCGTNTNGASRCVVLGNKRIQGSTQGFPPTAVGVRCDDGACNRIANNTIDGRGGVDSWGVRMMRTGALVERNIITGGCSTNSATGLYAEDAWSRIENNWISGGACGAGSATIAKTSRGMQVVAGPLPGEIDVNSNDLVGLGANGNACTSVGLELGALAGVSTPDGVYRDNILVAGACPTRYDLRETAAAADPRVLDHCDFAPGNAPTALYLDENTTPVSTAAGIDGIGGTSTLSADPMFVNYPSDLHIMAGSPCAAAGTSTGAPAIDIDGDPRGASPDIGADEIP